MSDWIPAFVLGILGVFATIYGTRSTRKTAQEASADHGIRETLKAAVEVNQKTYEVLAQEQKATIEELRKQLEKLITTNTDLVTKVGELETTVASQQDTIERLRQELEVSGHGPLTH